MTTYSIQFMSTASTIVTVDADSPDEARALADEQFEEPTLYAQCSRWGQSSNLELSDVWEQDESEGGVWSS